MNVVFKSAEGERIVFERYREFLRHWPVPHAELRVPTRHGETFVIASGGAGAPPLVLLHGSMFNSIAWMGDVAAWAEHFRVYAVDILGEPGFSAPTRPPLDSDAHAQWLDDVLGALEVAEVSLVGLSLGGLLAIDYAARNPQRVRCLAVLCPAGVGRMRMSTLKIALTVLPLLMLGERGRRAAVRKVLGPLPWEGTPEAAAVGAFMSLITRHVRPRVGKLPRFDDAVLARLAMPVLAIVGGLDPLLDSDETKRRIERNVPHARVRYLPDAGHAIVGETRPILEFLSSAGGGVAPAAAAAR